MTREEAIKRIKARFDKLALDDKDIEAIQTIIPELRESEDEKMRKEIIEYFKHYSGGDNISVKFPKWIAYLEKQKEQQSEVDVERELDKFYGMYRKDGKTYDIEDGEECVDWKEMVNPCFEVEFARHFYELGKNSK